MPKEFFQVTEGLVQKGDYLWDYDNFKMGHFTRCDVSFSSSKVGREIEYSGFKYSGKHKGREENEVTEYHNVFIIRKKSL